VRLGLLLIAGGVIHAALRTPRAGRHSAAVVAGPSALPASMSASHAGGAEGAGGKDAGDKNTNDWLRTAYAEAWKQYSHEDTLSLQRNNLFIIIQTALLAVLGTTTAGLLRVEPYDLLGYKVQLACLAMGALTTTFAAFAFVLLRNWANVTESAQAYVALRSSTCLRLEEVVGLQALGVSLADTEAELKSATRAKKGEYRPYPQRTSPKYESITSLGTIGWDSTRELIASLKALWIGLLTLGIGLIIIGTALTYASHVPPPPPGPSASGRAAPGSSRAAGGAPAPNAGAGGAATRPRQPPPAETGRP
jgi:hypothetical protein